MLRFKSAQAGKGVKYRSSISPTFDAVLKQIESTGKKSGCWIWYIFPTPFYPNGSETNNYYGMGSGNQVLENAKYYLNDTVLGPRLREITTIVLDKLKNGHKGEAKSITDIFGGDDKKFLSSVKLFAKVSPTGSIFHKVLSQISPKRKRKKPSKSPRKTFN